MGTSEKQTGEQKKGRGNVANLKPFKPGQSGNPKGRPKKGTALTDILKKYLDGKEGGVTRKQILVKKLFEMGKKGDAAAIRMIFDRIDGAVTQRVEAKHDASKDFVSLITEAHAKRNGGDKQCR